MPLGHLLTFVRWRRGESRRGRTGDSLPIDHPATGTACPACRKPIMVGQPWQLLAVGPTDAESAARHDAGRWYSAGATLCHRGCLDGLPDAALTDLADSLTPDHEEV